jgi:hypothetical protein
MLMNCCASCTGTGTGTSNFRCPTSVRAVPAALRASLQLDGFYKKYVNANGLSILLSNQPRDESLLRACRLVTDMLSKRDDVRILGLPPSVIW